MMRCSLKKLRFTLPALVVLTAFAAAPAMATTLYWSGSAGTGTWTDSRWSATSGSGYASAWTVGDDATFEGTGSTVSIASGTSISAGSLSFTAASYWISGGSLNLASGIINATTGKTTIASVITGSNGLTKNGSGDLYLAGANTYTGVTTINAGTVYIGGTDTVGNGTLSTGDIILNGGNLTFRQNTAHYTLANNISGAGAVGKSVLGNELILSGNNTYTGATNLLVGTLTLASSTALGSTAGGTYMTNGMAVLNLNGQTIGNESITTGQILASTYATITNGATTAASLAGNINFIINTGIITQTLVLNGVGDITLGGNVTESTTSGTTAIGCITKNGTNTVTLTGNITADGGITVSAGPLQFGDGSTNGSTVIGNIANSAALILNTGASTAETFSGVLSGAGTLTKTGNGLATLSNTNTFTGKTIVSAGTLSVTGSLDSSSIYIASAGSATSSFGSTRATYAKAIAASSAFSVKTAINSDFGTSGTVSGTNGSTDAALAVSWRTRSSDESGSTVGLLSDVINVVGGGATGGFTLTLSYSTSAMTSSDTSDIRLVYWDGSAWQRLVGSIVDATNHTVTATVSSSIASSYTQFAVVPEPRSVAMLALAGLGGLVAFGWRKRRN
jgi:autotransporter-associated beta strand protein